MGWGKLLKVWESLWGWMGKLGGWWRECWMEAGTVRGWSSGGRLCDDVSKRAPKSCGAPCSVPSEISFAIHSQQRQRLLAMRISLGCWPPSDTFGLSCDTFVENIRKYRGAGLAGLLATRRHFWAIQSLRYPESLAVRVSLGCWPSSETFRYFCDTFVKNARKSRGAGLAGLLATQRNFWSGLRYIRKK